jgi:hypothetical protein
MTLTNNDALYEEFHDALDAVEDAFAARFKHGARVALPETDRILRYGKRDADWMLFIDTLSTQPEARPWQPLSSSPTEVRVEATKHFGELWDACLAAEDERYRCVHEAIERARNFRDAVALMQQAEPCSWRAMHEKERE